MAWAGRATRARAFTFESQVFDAGGTVCAWEKSGFKNQLMQDASGGIVTAEQSIAAMNEKLAGTGRDANACVQGMSGSFVTGARGRTNHIGQQQLCVSHKIRIYIHPVNKRLLSNKR